MRNKQQTFRRRIAKHVKRCEATLCELMFAVDACHIKPHNICEEEEKEDQNNALMLLASIHRAFDEGYITFQDNGKIMFSPKMSKTEASCLGLTGTERIRMPGLRPKYMQYHRENIFKETI